MDPAVSPPIINIYFCTLNINYNQNVYSYRIQQSCILKEASNVTANQDQEIPKTTFHNECDPMTGRIVENSGLSGSDSRDAGKIGKDPSPIRQSCYGMTVSCSIYRTLEQIRRQET
jgi:hypothetical protein